MSIKNPWSQRSNNEISNFYLEKSVGYTPSNSQSLNTRKASSNSYIEDTPKRPILGGIKAVRYNPKEDRTLIIRRKMLKRKNILKFTLKNPKPIKKSTETRENLEKNLTTLGNGRTFEDYKNKTSKNDKLSKINSGILNRYSFCHKYIYKSL